MICLKKEELKEGQELRDSFIYDKKTNTIIGRVPFDEVQVDTLSYMTLTDKVLHLLNGTMEFRADESIDEEHDEPAQENWDNLDEDNLEASPLNEYSDKTDIIDYQVELAQKVQASQVIEGVETKKEGEKIVNQTITEEKNQAETNSTEK